MFSSSISERQNQSFGSPKEKMLRNSNIFKQEGESTRYLCEKHPNKKAKYYADNNLTKMFCSKCALTMALKGLKIEETSNEEESMRKNRLQSFTNQLSQLINVCEEKSKVLIENSNTLKASYNIQKDRCTQYFDMMITKLSQLKQQYLSKLSTIFTNQLQESQSMGNLMKSSDTQLRQFLFDIEKNVENIVKKMEMRPFEDIMTRYEKKVEEHQSVIESTNIIVPLNDIASQTKELIESQVAQLCDKIMNKNNNEIEEGDEIYQSTCSNSLQRSPNTNLNKPGINHSPMRLPPFPKSQIHTRKDSGSNTPDSCLSKRIYTTQPVIMKDQSDPISMLESPTIKIKNDFFSNEKPVETLNSIALSLKIGLNQLRENKTPKHLKQQSCQPLINQNIPSMSNSICKNTSEQKDQGLQMWSQNNLYQDQNQQSSCLSMKNKSIECNSIYTSNSQLRIMQQNKRCKGLSVQNDCSNSKSEGKRQPFIPQDNGEESSLKDRIFKELSGGSGTLNSESIYNQVLKINQKKPLQRFIKDKENFMSTDWAPLKKNSYLISRK